MIQIRPTLDDDGVMDFVASGLVVLEGVIDDEFNRCCDELEHGNCDAFIASAGFTRQVLLHPEVAADRAEPEHEEREERVGGGPGAVRRRQYAVCTNVASGSRGLLSVKFQKVVCKGASASVCRSFAPGGP